MAFTQHKLPPGQDLQRAMEDNLFHGKAFSMPCRSAAAALLWENVDSSKQGRKGYMDPENFALSAQAFPACR